MSRQHVLCQFIENHQRTQGDRASEEEVVRTRVSAASHVPQHGLQSRQQKWKGELGEYSQPGADLLTCSDES